MSNEVLRITADILPIPLVENDAPVTAFLDEVLEILASEGRVSAKESVGNDTEGPHINRLAVPLLQHDFWGGVTK
jgi:hypothetical protein